jgi:hypothetical protein
MADWSEDRDSRAFWRKDKKAAEAFDDHIAHLIRPVLGYFKPDLKEDPKFAGIGFTTTFIWLAKHNRPRFRGGGILFSLGCAPMLRQVRLHRSAIDRRRHCAH